MMLWRHMDRRVFANMKKASDRNSVFADTSNLWLTVNSLFQGDKTSQTFEVAEFGKML